MKSIKGTLTEQNLLKAFAGESQARTRYTFFASTAKKEGYEQIAATFLETAEQEKEEWDILYPTFAQTATDEGFTEIAAAFNNIASVEAEHERRYLKLLSRITHGDFFHRDDEIWWQCRNCGYIIRATDAPKLCPACLHPKAFFEPMKDNY